MNATTMLALLALNAPAAHNHDGPEGRGRERPVQTCPAHVMQAFDAVDNALRQAERELEGKHRVRDARRAIEDARAKNHDARIVACREARQPDVVVVNRPPTPVIRMLDEVSHANLLNAVKRESFDDGKLSVVSLGARDVCMTSTQANKLVKAFTFTKERVDALRILTPRIVDREQSYVMLDAFVFDSDKRVARDILMSTPTARECTLPRI